MTAKRLVEAARRGDAATVDELIGRGVKGTRRQIIEAARAGEDKVVDVLVRSGIRGTRAQLQAARDAGEAAVEEALLRSGAGGVAGQVLAASRRNDGPALAALRKAGAFNDAKHLVRAIGHDDVDAVRALLAGGADPNAVDPRGGGVVGMIMVAAADDEASGADPDALEMRGASPALVHAQSPEMVEALVAGGADPNREYVLLEVCEGVRVLPWGLATLKALLAAGADPNKRARPALDLMGLTALGHAVGVYMAEGGSDTERNRVGEMIEAMVGAGADTDEAEEIAEDWGRSGDGDLAFVLEALDRARRRRA